MKNMKRIALYFFSSIMVYGLAQCKSGYQLEKESSLEIGDAYYQYWVAGVEGGGSGINLFIPIKSVPENITLDSIYFRNKKSTIEMVNNNLAVGRFKSKTNTKKELIMSNEPFAEYANEVPKIPEKVPFDLKDDECVISYTENNRTKYFKISNIIKKEPKYFPRMQSRN